MVVTNALGVAFTATLLAASDAGVTFAFSEDGATNALAWAQLAPASRAAVCDALDFAPVPPALAATFAVARNEIASWETHRKAGFRELGVEDGFLRMMITKEAYLGQCESAD